MVAIMMKMVTSSRCSDAVTRGASRAPCAVMD
jgi:hypothetical protein